MLITAKYLNFKILTLQQTSRLILDWNKILIPFSRIQNENNTEYQLLKIERGSFLLFIGTTVGVVLGVGKAVNLLMDAIRKYMEIKKMALEMKKLKNDLLIPAIKEMEKAAKPDVKELSREIAQALIEEFAYHEHDKEEVKNGLVISTEKIHHFITEEGELKLLVPPDAPDGKDLLGEVLRNLERKHLELEGVKSEVRELSRAKPQKKLESPDVDSSTEK